MNISRINTVPANQEVVVRPWSNPVLPLGKSAAHTCPYQ